jgi:hypothetical protein
MRDGCPRISSLSSNPGELLARHDPASWIRTLAYRARAELPFDAGAVGGGTPVMLDTTVYLDALKPPGLPTAIATLVARNVVLHCSIACAELAVSVGHLDPSHAQTARHPAPLIDILSRMAPPRIMAPDADAWTEAPSSRAYWRGSKATRGKDGGPFSMTS